MKKNIFYCIILMCFSIENSFAQTTTTPPSEQIGEIRILTDEDVKQNELRKAEDKKILEESNRILLEKKAKEALKERKKSKRRNFGSSFLLTTGILAVGVLVYVGLDVLAIPY